MSQIAGKVVTIINSRLESLDREILHHVECVEHFDAAIRKEESGRRDMITEAKIDGLKSVRETWRKDLAECRDKKDVMLSLKEKFIGPGVFDVPRGDAETVLLVLMEFVVNENLKQRFRN